MISQFLHQKEDKQPHYFFICLEYVTSFDMSCSYICRAEADELYNISQPPFRHVTCFLSLVSKESYVLRGKTRELRQILNDCL